MADTRPLGFVPGNFISGTLLVIGVFVAMAALAVWEAFALTLLWGWFAVPLFGLPAMSLPFAVGVLLIAHLMAHPLRTEKTKSPWIFVEAVCRPAIAILAGWITTLFV